MPWRCRVWRATSGRLPLLSVYVSGCSHSIAQVVFHQVVLPLVQSGPQDPHPQKAPAEVSFPVQVNLRERDEGAAHEQRQRHGHAGGLCA